MCATMNPKKIPPIDQNCELDHVIDFVYQMARKRLRTSLSELRTIKAIRDQVEINRANISNQSPA